MAGQEYAEHYKNARFQTFWGRKTHARETRLLAGLLARCEGGSWLDVPCGAGRLTGLLPQKPAPVGCDLSGAMLTVQEGGRRLVRGSALALPFGDDTFAGVLCFRLLPHLPDAAARIRMLQELARVTRRHVVVSFFHRWCLQDLRRRFNHKVLGRRRGRRSVSLAQFQKEAAAAGLRLVEAKPHRRYISEQWLALLAKV